MGLLLVPYFVWCEARVVSCVVLVMVLVLFVVFEVVVTSLAERKRAG